MMINHLTSYYVGWLVCLFGDQGKKGRVAFAKKYTVACGLTLGIKEQQP